MTLTSDHQNLSSYLKKKKQDAAAAAFIVLTLEIDHYVHISQKVCGKQQTAGEMCRERYGG